MTEDQLHQIDQARRYAEQDEYVVTKTHIRNLLAIIDERDASVPDGWRLVPIEPNLQWAKKMREISVYSDKACDGLIRIALAAAPDAPKP